MAPERAGGAAGVARRARAEQLADDCFPSERRGRARARAPLSHVGTWRFVGTAILRKHDAETLEKGRAVLGRVEVHAVSQRYAGFGAPCGLRAARRRGPAARRVARVGVVAGAPWRPVRIAWPWCAEGAALSGIPALREGTVQRVGRPSSSRKGPACPAPRPRHFQWFEAGRGGPGTCRRRGGSCPGRTTRQSKLCSFRDAARFIEPAAAATS